MKAYDLLKELYKTNPSFRTIVSKYIKTGHIRFFSDLEWEKIKNQNFISPIPEMHDFFDMFLLGYNIGNCVGTSRQLSYSYDDVDIVSGTLPILKGTLHAKNGGHCWLETSDSIIDTSLMLVIKKSLKEELGYQEEERLTKYQLNSLSNYRVRKEFVNDRKIKKVKRKSYNF